jgi:hypothetical protein
MVRFVIEKGLQSWASAREAQNAAYRRKLRGLEKGMKK